jgi:hypothetical protein
MRNAWPQTTLVLRLAMVLLLTLGLGSLAQGGKPNKSSPLNVTSTVYDYTDSTNSTPNLLRSDNASGQASYDTGNNVRSQIFGFWYLDLTSQTTRSVYLTFSDYVSGQMNPLPNGYYNAEVISRCFDTNNNIIDFLSVNLSDNRCSLRVDFTSGGTTYYFVMSPESQYAGTGWATVVCNSAPNGACVSWTITPTTTGTNAANATVATLNKVSHGGKQMLIGSYHNTYRIDVTNP